MAPVSQHQGLARLILGFVCIHACMAGVRMGAPLLWLREGGSGLEVGILLALFAVMQVFISLPAGRYVDAFGFKQPVRWALCAAALGALLAAASHWLPLYGSLCFAALLVGGASGVTIIALQRHAGSLAQGPTELKRIFSWLALGPAVSNFLGPFVVGLLIDHFNFETAFAAMALLPLLAWTSIRAVRDAVHAADAARDLHKANGAWDLLRMPSFRQLLLVNWFMSACWDVHTFVVPVLGHERGLSAATIGSILGAFAIAAAAVRLLLPLLAHRLEEHKVITVAMGSTLALYVLYPLVEAPLGMGLCSVALGFVLGSVQPMVMSTLHQITPQERQGEALGLRLMIVNASSVAMPVTFGVVSAALGVASVFWLVAGSLTLGIHAAWGLKVGRNYE